MPTPAIEYEVSPQLEKELERHAGKWVATSGDEVIAAGDTATEVFKEAQRQGVDLPTVFRVPEDEGEAYFF